MALDRREGNLFSDSPRLLSTPPMASPQGEAANVAATEPGAGPSAAPTPSAPLLESVREIVQQAGAVTASTGPSPSASASASATLPSGKSWPTLLSLFGKHDRASTTRLLGVSRTCVARACPCLLAQPTTHTLTHSHYSTHTHTHTHSHARATNGRARVVTLRVVPPSRGGYEGHGQTAHSCGPSQGIGHARPAPRSGEGQLCQGHARPAWQVRCGVHHVPPSPCSPGGTAVICCSLHSAHLLIGRRRTTVSGRHACCCGAPGGHPGLGINLCVWCSRPVRPPASDQAVRLSSALPPVSAKIAASGQYVPMKNLLPDNVSLCLQLALPGPHVVYWGLPKPRLREVQSPLTWVSCFLAYVAVLTPDPKTRDLLTYARLVVREAQRHGGPGWQEYDKACCPGPYSAVERAEPQPACLNCHDISCGASQCCGLCHEPDHEASACALLVLQPGHPPVPPVPAARGPGTRANKYPQQFAGSHNPRPWRPRSVLLCYFRHICATCKQKGHRARDCEETPGDSQYKSAQRLAANSTRAQGGGSPVPS